MFNNRKYKIRVVATEYSVVTKNSVNKKKIKHQHQNTCYNANYVTGMQKCTHTTHTSPILLP